MNTSSTLDAHNRFVELHEMPPEPGYEDWLSGKVGRTLQRVVSGESSLHDDDEAMAALSERITRLCTQADGLLGQQD